MAAGFFPGCSMLALHSVRVGGCMSLLTEKEESLPAPVRGASVLC